MSVLPDHEIRRAAILSEPPLISPFNEARLQPASYDVQLGAKILVPTEHGETVVINNPIEEGRRRTVDLSKPLPKGLYTEVDITDGYTIYPSQFILAVTIERVHVPSTMVGRIEGKSSIGRLGLTAHITAGYLDPGFQGCVTLEMVNFFTRPIRLHPGKLIAQIGFEWMSSPCDHPYGSSKLDSHYQGADGVQGSRYGQ